MISYDLIIIIIIYFGNVTFFHAELGLDVCKEIFKVWKILGICTEWDW